MKEISPNIPAGYTAHNLPPRYKDLMGYPVQVRIYINCYGDPIEAIKAGLTSTFLAKQAPGAEWAYPEFACFVERQENSPPEMFIDTRSLWLLQQGCCPIALTAEQLGGEESTD
ncbi:hypothetical protein ES708_14142 [subsurface metagenome]